MAVVTDLKVLLDAYGVAVRAGAITPQIEDETYFRGVMDLPEMSESVKSLWSEQRGYRQPLTLAGEDESEPSALNEDEVEDQ